MRIASEHKVGDRIYIKRQAIGYKIQARDNRYVIATKPYNIKHTVLYFIIDTLLDIRGPDDRVFCSGYETKEQCEERLKELQSGKISVSRRNSVPADDIVRVKVAK